MLNITNNDQRHGIIFFGMQLGMLIVITSLNIFWVYVIRTKYFITKYTIALVIEVACILAFMNTLELFEEIETPKFVAVVLVNIVAANVWLSVTSYSLYKIE